MTPQDAYEALQREAKGTCSHEDDTHTSACACQTLAVIGRVERLIFYVWDEELENHFTAHEAAIRAVLGIEVGADHPEEMNKIRQRVPFRLNACSDKCALAGKEQNNAG
jgi:hypothetical protein